MFWLQVAITFGVAVGYGYFRSRNRADLAVPKYPFLMVSLYLLGGVVQLFGALALCLTRGGFAKSNDVPMAIWAWVLLTASAVLLIHWQTLAIQTVAQLSRNRANESFLDSTRHNSEKL